MAAPFVELRLYCELIGPTSTTVLKPLECPYLIKEGIMYLNHSKKNIRWYAEIIQALPGWYMWEIKHKHKILKKEDLFEYDFFGQRNVLGKFT